MKYFNLKPVKNKKGVYLFYVGTQLAYIGKSSNLISRLQQHLNFELKKNITESWKTEISKIEYYFCNSLVDCELLETYLISVLKPKYNIDKVYPDTLSLIVSNLPTKYCLEEVEAGFKKINQRKFIKAYCDDEISLEVASNTCALIKETIGVLSKRDYKRLGFQPDKIRKEFNNLRSQEFIDKEVKNLFTLGFYLSKDIKVILTRLYEDIGLEKKAKASDIERIFNIQAIRKCVNNKTVVGYKIV